MPKPCRKELQVISTRAPRDGLTVAAVGDEGEVGGGAGRARWVVAVDKVKPAVVHDKVSLFITRGGGRIEIGDGGGDDRVIGGSSRSTRGVVRCDKVKHAVVHDELADRVVMFRRPIFGGRTHTVCARCARRAGCAHLAG